MDRLPKTFGDIQPFLTNSTDLAPSPRNKLLSILDDTTKKGILELEISIVVDAGAPSIRATYNLEGDGPLVSCCCEVLNTVQLSIQSTHYPNTTAVAQRMVARNHQAFQQLMAYAKQCIQPAYDYFQGGRN